MTKHTTIINSDYYLCWALRLITTWFPVSINYTVIAAECISSPPSFAFSSSLTTEHSDIFLSLDTILEQWLVLLWHSWVHATFITVTWFLRFICCLAIYQWNTYWVASCSKVLSYLVKNSVLLKVWLVVLNKINPSSIVTFTELCF
jgi:hypothetical protein